MLNNKFATFKKGIFFLFVIFAVSCKDSSSKNTTPVDNQPSTSIIQLVYTSDSHFGITRGAFRGATNVDANIVNIAMAAKMNTVSTLTLPNDNGVRAGKVVGGIDYLINTGDIANRQEVGIQSATASWIQFTSVYLNGLTLKNNSNQNTGILVSAGNHDVSNTIGYYKLMSPLTDNSTMVGIYNYMFPSTPKTTATYNYTSDKIHYSKDLLGVHFEFVNIWPDSTERVWMEKDLSTISTTTPVIIFTHDPPAVESKHFINPNGTHTINATDKFENLIPEAFKDGTTISVSSNIEQRGFVAFLKNHTNIKAYFHGHNNENNYYTWGGPDSDIALKVFQVDSPMKGNVSASDETRLSFQLITIDSNTKIMTVRECLWNAIPSNPLTPIAFGASCTISLK